MKIVKLLLLMILIIPVLYIGAGMVASLDAIGPSRLGPCNNTLYFIARVGEKVQKATEATVMYELEAFSKIAAFIGERISAKGAGYRACGYTRTGRVTRGRQNARLS